MSQRRAGVQFAVLGLGTGIIYLALALRLPWWRYGTSLQSWRQILGGQGRDPVSFATCLACAGLLMMAYLWGWRLVSSGSVRSELVWTGAALFGLAVFWLLPITSDLFAYLSHAHMVTDLGVNPLTTPPMDMASDRLVRAYLARYATQPAAYGPAWLLMSSLGTLGALDLVTGVIYLKTLAYVSYLACAWLIGELLSAGGPRPSLAGVYLFAWNPLVILLAVGDGHNDVVMIAAALLSLWLLRRRMRALSFLVLTVSVLTKYVTVILLPLFLLYVLRGEPLEWPSQRAGAEWDRHGSWFLAVRRRSLSVAKSMLGGVVASLVILAPFGSPSWLVGLTQRFLRPANLVGSAADVSTRLLVVGMIVFALCYAVLAWRSWRRGLRFWELADASFLVLLLAFALGAVRSQPWHLIWAAAFMPLSRRRWAMPLTTGLSAVMLVTQVWVEWGAPGLGLGS